MPSALPSESSPTNSESPPEPDSAVFYLKVTGEIVLVKRFNDLPTACKYYPENREKEGISDGGLKWANEIMEKGWLS
ncbi:hypothetical protein B0T21DRAFT_384184 [Apiosordaria backusii]|uniref:Uncharacterized protein n=1 Tax=Apiosordaria backusii TaxID=314023 RepID=A0AA40BMA2_9PEZI|nr:hypothetical protein B0T21DRAFT_384184 [Apiosordaria backusii]